MQTTKQVKQMKEEKKQKSCPNSKQILLSGSFLLAYSYLKIMLPNMLISNEIDSFHCGDHCRKN